MLLLLPISSDASTLQQGGLIELMGTPQTDHYGNAIYPGPENVNLMFKAAAEQIGSEPGDAGYIRNQILLVRAYDAQMRSAISAHGRLPRQRTTLYRGGGPQRASQSFAYRSESSFQDCSIYSYRESLCGKSCSYINPYGDDESFERLTQCNQEAQRCREEASREFNECINRNRQDPT